MLSIFAPNPATYFGLAAMLDLERIAYRRIEKIADDHQAVVVAAAEDLSDAQLAILSERRSLVLHGGIAAARRLGAVHARAVTQPCRIALDAPVWTAEVGALARRHSLTHLHLPSAAVCLSTPAPGHVLATLAGEAHPLVVRSGDMVWCAIDLGAAFTTLCRESYLPDTHQHAPPRALARWLRRRAETVYYAAPEALRQAVQAYSYRQLEPRLQALGALASTYPIDPTGWLLVELFKQVLRLAAGRSVGLAHWPAPYRAAATITHDIEPRRYAYTTGLDRLLHETSAEPHLHTFGLVAEACEQHLPDANALCLEHRNVLCHGLTHRGEVVSGRDQVAAHLTQARQRLERHLRRRVKGYRSPRLDRSADLQWALDQSGFEYDSSYPDVDRENLRHFGGGVRLNLPFRPPVASGDHRLRASRCLELPLTAPDCIQPLFAGASPEQLMATITAKADYVRDSGGLYVALVHAGVFGDADATRRETLLRHVRSLLRHPEVWLAGLPEIVDWWTAREAVEVAVLDGTLRVRNSGARFITGLRLVVDDGGPQQLIQLPGLSAGEEIVLALPPGRAGDAEATLRATPRPALLH